MGIDYHKKYLKYKKKYLEAKKMYMMGGKKVGRRLLRTGRKGPKIHIIPNDSAEELYDEVCTLPTYYTLTKLFRRIVKVAVTVGTRRGTEVSPASGSRQNTIVEMGGLLGASEECTIYIWFKKGRSPKFTVCNTADTPDEMPDCHLHINAISRDNLNGYDGLTANMKKMIDGRTAKYQRLYLCSGNDFNHFLTCPQLEIENFVKILCNIFYLYIIDVTPTRVNLTQCQDEYDRVREDNKNVDKDWSLAENNHKLVERTIWVPALQNNPSMIGPIWKPLKRAKEPPREANYIAIISKLELNYGLKDNNRDAKDPQAKASRHLKNVPIEVLVQLYMEILDIATISLDSIPDKITDKTYDNITNIVVHILDFSERIGEGGEKAVEVDELWLVIRLITFLKEHIGKTLLNDKGKWKWIDPEQINQIKKEIKSMLEEVVLEEEQQRVQREQTEAEEIWKKIEDNLSRNDNGEEQTEKIKSEMEGEMVQQGELGGILTRALSHYLGPGATKKYPEGKLYLASVPHWQSHYSTDSRESLRPSREEASVLIQNLARQRKAWQETQRRRIERNATVEADLMNMISMKPHAEPFQMLS